MLGDPLRDVDGIAKRYESAVERHTRLTVLRDQLQEELVAKEKEILTLGSEIETLSKVGELFRVLMDLLVEKQVKLVERIGTRGVQSVFDPQLSLESSVEPKYNKISVEFFFRKGDKDHPASYRGKPLESFGGGPCSFVSLIFRVLAVKKLNLWPMLVLDESLGAVSDEYIEGTGKFIRELVEQLGFDILLVTHKPAFLEHATSSYRCTDEAEDDGVSSYVVLKKAW